MALATSSFGGLFTPTSSFIDQSETMVPNIIDFVVDPQYLNRSGLYPRQGTFLKILFLQDELFTDYDHEVIAEWIQGFTLPQGLAPIAFDAEGDTDLALRYQGTWGLPPDIYDRIAILKSEGKKWFREAVVVIGRRGGKGHIGALAGAYVLWNYLAKGDPQGFYGTDRDKRLSCMVFASKLGHAKANQWRDLHNMITGAPCFRDWDGTDFISKDQAETLTVYAPYDQVRLAQRKRQSSEFDLATFSIEPKEATIMGGKGPAAFMQFYDEMAMLVTAAGASRSAEEIYGAATPALAQFGGDAFLYEGSSPWQMMGQFYTNWQNALEVDRHTHEPMYPDMVTIQLESWDIYEDWARAHEIPMYPGGACYQAIRAPMVSYDSAMRKKERANPEGFAVEYKAHWAAAMDAYLNPAKITEAFAPWNGRKITRTDHGVLSTRYVAHADPSKSGANFAFAIGHVEGPDDNGLLHVVYDEVTHWEPGDFEDMVIDYIKIEEYLKDYIGRFRPNYFSFDQWNSVAIIQRLQRWAAQQHFPNRVSINERTATAPLNWKVAETFKSALNLGLIHIPDHELAELELRFLIDKGNNKVDKPDSGPVQTKDIFDALSNVAYTLIGEQMMAILGERFTGPATPAMQGGEVPFGQTGINPSANPEQMNVANQFSAFRRSSVPGSGNSPVRMGRFGSAGMGHPGRGSRYGSTRRRSPG